MQRNLEKREGCVRTNNDIYVQVKGSISTEYRMLCQHVWNIVCFIFAIGSDFIPSISWYVYLISFVVQIREKVADRIWEETDKDNELREMVVKYQIDVFHENSRKFFVVALMCFMNPIIQNLAGHVPEILSKD